MPSFDDVQLDPTISYGATGGVSFRTIVVSSDAGTEQRNPVWPLGRLRWKISHEDRSRTEMTSLIQFFRARQGRARGFRFKDWTDYTAVNEPIQNTGINTIQLQKTYSDIGNTVVRPIRKPVNGITETKNYTGIKLYINGALQSSGYTVDYTTGIVTMSTSHPGATILWNGEFDVPVRFNTDDMNVTVVDFDIRTWGDIEVIEVIG